jgi:imidazole glycerol-phosphate synthase subunit HisH
MVIVVDFGIGNIGSIVNMISRLGVSAKVTSSADDVRVATSIILPGVGAYGYGMEKLNESGLIPSLEDRVIVDKIPLLGICLGMQLLFDFGEEGNVPGLGWVGGTVKRFDFSNYTNTDKPKLPHMGWNVAKPFRDTNVTFDAKDEQRFYFVHSFHCVCDNEDDILLTSHYGYEFTCAIKKDNIYGVQFHPEKSHRFGLELLKTFLLDSTC